MSMEREGQHRYSPEYDFILQEMKGADVAMVLMQRAHFQGYITARVD